MQPVLGGFVLIGGSALALRIQHRLSEDLDCAFIGDRLPRPRLEALSQVGVEANLDFQRDDDEGALHEFANGGLELHDYQQNFIVNNVVRVSFFAPDAALCKVLAAPAEPVIRLATLDELFKAKCLVAALRSKTRDWLDLYLLLRDHGFTMRDFSDAFQQAGVAGQRDNALARLCSGVPQNNDEGYVHLLKQPPSLEEMKAFFIAQRNRYEVESSAHALRKRTAQESDRDAGK